MLIDPTAVTYVMEFLERRHHADRAQFWLLVEGLKDPLEGLESDEPRATDSILDSDAATSALEDIRMIWSAYLAGNPFRSSEGYLRVVQAFVEQEDPRLMTPQALRQVRHALFAVQQEVLTTLEEEDAPAFSRSDLYFKALAALPATSAESVITPPSRTHPLPLVTPPTPAIRTALDRTRSRSNPQLLTTSAMSPTAKLPSPPAPDRPPSPGFLTSPTSARTDTAPPQLTFHAAFDRARSDDLFEATSSPFEPIRKVSSGSLETVASASTFPSAKRKTNGMTDSLDFLISPQSVETERMPLFGNEPTDGTDTPPSDDDFVQVQTIEAIQEALNSILASDARAQPHVTQSTASLPALKDTSLPPPPRRTSTAASKRSSGPGTPALSSSVTLPNRPPSILAPRASSQRSLSVPRKVAARTVFDDTEVTDDNDGSEDEFVEEPASDDLGITSPVAGDLSLATEIPRLADLLEKLRKQEVVVDALIRKAELTGVASELKVLVKSRESLRREIRAATFQKDQLETQAAQNELSPTRTRISIPGTTVGQASSTGSGATFQLYLVEVYLLADDGTFQAGWITTRRYSEFLALYNKLKEKFPSTRAVEFPSKRLVGAWSKEFIEQRRVGLERYLQVLDWARDGRRQRADLFDRTDRRQDSGYLRQRRTAILSVERDGRASEERCAAQGSPANTPWPRSRSFALSWPHNRHRRRSRHVDELDGGADGEPALSAGRRVRGCGGRLRPRRGPRRPSAGGLRVGSGWRRSSRRRRLDVLRGANLRSPRDNLRAQGEEQLAAPTGYPDRASTGAGRDD